MACPGAWATCSCWPSPCGRCLPSRYTPFQVEQASAGVDHAGRRRPRACLTLFSRKTTRGVPGATGNGDEARINIVWAGSKLALSKQRRPFEPALTPSAMKLIDCHPPCPWSECNAQTGASVLDRPSFMHAIESRYHTICTYSLSHSSHTELEPVACSACYVSQSQRSGRSHGFKVDTLTGEIASEEPRWVLHALRARVGFARLIRLSWC